MTEIRPKSHLPLWGIAEGFPITHYEKDQDFEFFVFLNMKDENKLRRILEETERTRRTIIFDVVFSTLKINLYSICLEYISVEELNHHMFSKHIRTAIINGAIDVLIFCFEVLRISPSVIYDHDEKRVALPLHLAVTHKNLDIVRLLFSYGVDANIKHEIKEFSPFHFVILRNSPEIFDEFVVNGADLSSRFEGVSLFECALYHNSIHIAARLFNLGLANEGMRVIGNSHGYTFAQMLLRINDCVNDTDGEDKTNRFLFSYFSHHEDDIILARNILFFAKNLAGPIVALLKEIAEKPSV